MEFWGVEVKPGQNLKCEPGDERVLHLSQASLGESKKEKGNEAVPIFVKINDQKLILGTLSSEKCAQIQYDLVFEKEFELSHGSKHASVFFVGYRSVYQGNESEEEEFSDSDSEEDLQIAKKINAAGILPKIEAGKSVPEKDNVSGKVDNPSAKQKAKADTKENIKTDKVEDKDEDDSDDDQDGDSDEESEDDEDMVEAVGGDSSEEDDNESSDEEGGNPKKVAGSGVKRSADSKQKTPVPEKKAKLVTPTGNQKAGGKDGKKAGGGHVATPYPSKKGEKPQQSPKSGGTGSVVCKTCNRTFNHENALQDHTKAKHGAAAAAK